MTIPFIKAHGAGNDFLLTWADRVTADDLPAIARAICNRHTGIGADGWILIRDTSIRLFNADGSEAEISGNGTRCAAAVLIDSGRAASEVTISTGAGPKNLCLMERSVIFYSRWTWAVQCFANTRFIFCCRFAVARGK
jgi:diaminopimelate epimerase